MNIKNATELIKLISENKAGIYGAGFIGKRFYKAVCEKGIENNIEFFITSGEPEKKTVDGLPVMPLHQVKDNDGLLVCIAVHESIKNEIINTLKERGFTKYVWVSPFLYELMLGEPIEKNAEISLRDIWKATSKTYAMAFRYLAAEQYYGLRDDGYDIYVRGLSIFNSVETSQKRLKKYIELLKNWDKNGYDKNCTVSLMEDYYPIDGNHRLAIAMFKKMDHIICDVYPSTKSLSEIHGDASFSKERAEELGFDKNTIRILEETNRKIEEQYGQK